MVLAWTAPLSALLQLAPGWHPDYATSGAMFAFTLTGAGLGGYLYTLQLARVRALVAPRVAARTPAGT